MRRNSPSDESTDTVEVTSDEITPEAVAARRFDTTRKGFEPETVVEFLGTVAEHIRMLEGRLRAARGESASLRLAAEKAYAAEVVIPVVVQEVPAPAAAEEQVPTEVAAGPDLEEVSAEATRIVTAAEENAREIVEAAEGRATEIQADARMEAESLKVQADEYGDRAARRLAIQSQEVRDRLREEVRRVRAEVADEAERLLARARAEADLLAAEGDAAESEERVVSRLVADAEAETDAARQATEILAGARAKADEIVAHARQSRKEIVARLNDERVRLEEHVRLLQTVQKRLQADVTAARNAFASVLGNLDGLKLHDAELPVLDTELVALVDLDLDAVGAGAAPEAAEGGAHATHLGEIAADATPVSDEGTDDLFDRVIADRERDAGTGMRGGPRAESSDTAELEETTWGDDAGPDPGEVAASPAPPDPRDRLKAAFSTLTAELDTLGDEAAEDDPEPPPAETAEAAPPGEDSVATQDEAEPGVPSADAMAEMRELALAELQPAATRKLKRALQQAENIALHAHQTGGSISADELTSELHEHVQGVLAEVVTRAARDASLHVGTDPGADALDVDTASVQEIIDAVAGGWWGALAADLAATDEDGVHGVIRSRRQQASRIAADLAREAYDSGLLRAAEL
ncbi:MAG: hypothetical protein IT198_08760 [Acidimicrobiia bacterium]|nr:hypothetical protein [Acidimicrobiia bacterium]